MGVVATLTERRREEVGPQTCNLWRTVRFAVEDVVLERRLVVEAVDLETEISAASPVGKALTRASPGERITVEAPGGYVVVKVLHVSLASSIAESGPVSRTG